MEDSQREAMYNGWAKNKVFLKTEKRETSEWSMVECKYEGKSYWEVFYRKDCIGSADPYNIAFNRLLAKMKEINKNIELTYLT